jgi:alpha-ribazole phosphatase
MSLAVWRHPRPQGVAGRCIGRTDVFVDRRRAKRLAHRIRAAARREGLPRRVFTSPLQRCKTVGQALRGMGFEHVVDADLLELDFGSWDGQPWTVVTRVDVAAWEADFVHHAPGGGEALASLMQRVQRFLSRSPVGVVVAHAGWISACSWLAQHPNQAPTATAWPASLRYMQRVTALPSSA